MPLLPDASGPPDLRLYAIGDVHGRLDLLREVHARIARDLVSRPPQAFRVIHLGDVIDRGADSRGVIERLIEHQRDGDAVTLLGNHEGAALDFLRDPLVAGERWLAWGGLETLASYGVEAAAPGVGLRSIRDVRDAFARALPEAHRRFLEGLPLAERHGDFLFVHAGVRPGRRLERQRADDLTFIREPFLSDPRDHGAVVVHGHTPRPEPEIRPNRINLDTKAWESGRLSCLVIDGERRALLGEGGLRPCEPTG